MQYLGMTLALIGYSIVLAIVNYEIMVLLYNKTFSDLMKMREIRYTLLSREKGLRKQVFDKLVYQGMDESMKRMTYIGKPIIFQFCFLTFALLPLSRIYKGYTVGINLFGWRPGWLFWYFITYMIVVSILSAMKMKEKMSMMHERQVV